MADQKISALTAVTTPADADEFAVNQAGTSKKMTLLQIAQFLFARAVAATVAAGEFLTHLTLAADSSNITGTTSVAVMTVTGVGIGKYHLHVVLIYQTTATTTGIDVYVKHGATTVLWNMEHRFTSTGGAAATAAATSNSAVATGNTYEGQGTRSQSTIVGAGTVSVDAANADHMSVIEGVFEVTAGAATTLTVELAAEAAALVCKARRGSRLVLTRLE